MFTGLKHPECNAGSETVIAQPGGVGGNVLVVQMMQSSIVEELTLLLVIRSVASDAHAVSGISSQIPIVVCYSGGLSGVLPPCLSNRGLVDPCFRFPALHNLSKVTLYFQSLSKICSSDIFVTTETFIFQRTSTGVCREIYFVAHGRGALYQVSIPYHTIPYHVP